VPGFFRRLQGAKLLHKVQYPEKMMQEFTVFGQFLNTWLAEVDTPPVYNFIVLVQIEIDAWGLLL
jgi:hypothetical protein